MLLAIVVLAAGFAAGSLVVGWWAVPLLAAVFGMVAPVRVRPVTSAVIAAVLAWGAWLAADASFPAFTRLASRLTGTVSAPLPVLIAVTLIHGAALAGGAAVLTSSFRTGPAAPGR